MIAEILSKVGGSSSTVDSNVIHLSSPSIVELKIAPEQVQKYERVGQDLKMVLPDGSTIVVEGFFNKDADGNRSDLVLQDDSGVLWWGQYPARWDGFHFMEIEDGMAGIPPWLQTGLGLLGVGGIAAAAAGGGGGNDGDSDTNHPPIAATDTVRGHLNTVVTGNVLTNDHDPDGDSLVVTDFRVDADGDGITETYRPGDMVTFPGEGILVLNPDGSYTFTPDTGWHGDIPTVNYTTSDGNGGTDTANLNITIAAPPVGAGTIADQANDDADTGISVDVKTAFTDADSPVLTYSASGLPPGLSIDPTTGLITGDVDHSASQGGTSGDYAVTITATDGDGQTATQTFTWTVANPGPAAVADSGSGDEDTTVTGNVLGNDTDPDGDTLTVKEFNVDTDGDGVLDTTLAAGGTATITGVGTLVIDSTGNYTFVPETNWNGDVPKVTYTATDSEGGDSTADLKITIKPVQDPPEAVDDLAGTDPDSGTPTTGNVLANDDDPDNHDNDSTNDTLVVTQFQVDTDGDGTPETYTAGATATIVGVGDITITSTGDYTFAPDPGWDGKSPSVSYTVDDGHGNTDTANLNIVGVHVVDDAKPGDATVGDSVLASIDDLGHVQLSGQAVAGGTITSLTVSDGTTTVTVPASDITVNADGTFTATSDLSGLADGNLTVTLDVTDARGNAATAVDHINKDTVTDVTIDPLFVVDGNPPSEITGTAEKGATIVLTIGSESPVTVTADATGKWTYTPTTKLDLSEVTIQAEATDQYGNTDTTTRKVAGLTVTDAQPADSADVLVHESALADGSDPASTSETATSTFVIGTTEGGIDHLVIGGAESGGALSGGTTVTLAQLQDVGTTAIPSIATTYGSITITGYDASSHTITYTYSLTGNTDAHSASGNDTVREDILVAVVDNNGDTRVGQLVAGVVDDVPGFGTADAGTVKESGLPLGSDPDASDLQATGDLNLTPGADGTNTSGAEFTDTSDPDSTVSKLDALGLTSAGAALEYVVSADGHTITAYNSATHDSSHQIFTAVIGDSTSGDAGYTFTLDGPLDHDGKTSLDLDFGVTVTDGDGDTAQSSFTITVEDDAPKTAVTEEVDEDDSTTFNTSADANPDNTVILDSIGNPLTGTDDGSGGKAYDVDHGTVTVNSDGKITYTPDANYSGTDTFTYQTTDGAGTPKKTTVTMTVNPVSDAPTVSADDTSISTPEDTSVALGLNVPLVTDNSDGNGSGTAGDSPERLGVITLTGIPDGAVLAAGTLDGTAAINHSATGDPITIFISDAPTVADLTLPPGTLTMTQAQFEALQVTPPENAHENFTVHMAVSSYEVDDSGHIAQVGGSDVPGAESSLDVVVDVQAVTDTGSDAPTLTLEQPTAAADVGAESITTTPAVSGTPAKIDVAMDEDGTLDLQSVLKEGFNDTDGSETLWYQISGLPEGTEVTIGGHTYTAGADGKIDSSAHPVDIGSASQNPDFTIKPPQNYSNSGPIDAKITLNVQDHDSDSPSVAAGVETIDVDLSLRVYAKPDDVTLAGSTTAEDTAVAFLPGLSTSLKDDDGSETITQVRITGLPTEGDVAGDTWQLLDHNGDPIAVPPGGDATGGGLVLTVGTGPGEYTLAQIEQFQLVPPGHSSLDGNLTVYVTTTEAGSNTQSGAPESTEWPHDLTVKVKPKAETTNQNGDMAGALVDTDGDGMADLGMSGNHDFKTHGQEDEWFSLNRDSKDTSFKLEGDWHNEDTSEQTYARLTPHLDGGDGSMADAIGSVFRWSEDGGATWQERTFTGTPIDVPMEYLSTLEFKAAPNFSGMFRIKVQAHTVDADQDGGSDKPEATTGESWLTNVLIEPSADDVTLALNGHASGNEDDSIPLSIRPTSSDLSETFNITISNIPDGAKVTYDGTVYDTGTTPLPGGLTQNPDGTFSLVLSDFHSSKSLSIQPPHNSNDNFTLNVSSESVDTLTIGADIYEDKKAGPSLSIDVDVRGVADSADVSVPPTTPSYAEKDIDGNTAQVLLKDLVSVDLTDTDGSEVLTIRVSGLPDGFSPDMGTLLTDPTIVGESRVWVLTKDQFNAAQINVPANYSGEVAFKVGAVTTEDDGDSRTGDTENVHFIVTPSPEATTTNNTTLTEDKPSNIGLEIVHENGDSDETLDSVRIKVGDDDTANFTLYLDDGSGTLTTLADAVGAGHVTQVPEGGTDYYVLDSTATSWLSAQGGANLDGDLVGFDFQYKITDSHYGAAASGSTTSGWQPGHFDLAADAVTDGPDASITEIEGTKVTTTSTEVVPGNDADPDTVSMSEPDKVTVTLNVTSPDDDGSEHIVRVVIDGVPEGVTVTGGEYIGGGQWLLVYDGTDPVTGAQQIGGSGLQLPVEFNVSGQAGGLTGHAITITAQAQDRGDQTDPGTSIESDSVTWKLTTTFPTGAGEDPATIDTWAYNNAAVTEDVPFSLSDIVDADITVHSHVENILTITLQDLPPGTQVVGMTSTTITEGGVTHEVWSASAITTPGDTDADIQAALKNLMDSITITPPLNSNENNAAGAFDFDAKLTTSVAGGGQNNTADIPAADLTVPVTPVTDNATISIGLDTAVDADLNESDTSIPITLTVSDAADGTSANIVDGNLYLQVSSTTAGLQGGTLTVDGTLYTLEPITGVSGVPDGDYYVVPGVSMGDSFDLVYTPGAGGSTMTAGDVKVDAWVRNTEDGSAEDTGNSPLTSTGSGTLEVHISNDGAVIGSALSSGSEVAGKSGDAPIELTGLTVGLNDDDGSEDIISILLKNLPEGFLVYTGADAGSAELASNAGGENGYNTWVISNADGSLPGYVGIVPPAHWSGTLSDLKVVVESGETALTETRISEHDLADVTVTPVTDGLDLTTTKSFGYENAIIALNLNASMQDPQDTTVKSTAGTDIAHDDSRETASLKITGLGAHASFYVDDPVTGEHTQLGSTQFTYDAGTDSYILTGLSQDDLNTLAFMQAQSALTDQNTSTTGTQIHVEAWTVESGTSAESAHKGEDITLNVSAQLATTGDDSLIWTGKDIDAGAGADVVHLRQGESLTGAELASTLDHVETIDMSIGGGNDITALTPEQVRDILGSGATTGLTIKGTADDAVTLDGSWTQNPDGTWTGTIGTGSTATDVTLTVDGAVNVAEIAGFAGPSAALMSFAFDFDDTGSEQGTDELAFLFVDGGTPPPLDSVLAPGTGASHAESANMDTWLPGQDAATTTSPHMGVGPSGGDGAAAYAAFVPDVPLPDDELQHSLASAHAIG